MRLQNLERLILLKPHIRKISNSTISNRLFGQLIITDLSVERYFFRKFGQTELKLNLTHTRPTTRISFLDNRLSRLVKIGMDQSTFKTQIIATNKLVKVEDLLDIRCSYSLDGESSDAIAKRYSEELQQITNRIFIVGLIEGCAFGYVQLVTHNADNDPELADGSQIAHIHDLRIKSDLQGKGFGRYLITCLEEEARFRGFKILTLGVDSWNSRAIKFYQDFGFAEFKQEPGRTYDEVVLCMKKKL